MDDALSRFAPPRSSATALVEASGLWLTVPARPGTVNAQGGLDIVRDMSLRVNAGESVGIVGPSGSGKTSLLMLLAGLERPTRGTVRVDGVDLGTLGENRLARFRGARIGIVFQSFHLIPTMTALDNVAVPLELAGTRNAASIARTALEQVGLAHRMTHLPGQLSGGEQQRVAIARAFAPRPALLLADEPTGNLDARTGESVQALLFGLQRDNNTALVLITHDPVLAGRCDRVVEVAEGRLRDRAA
ncbi:ATP-binding cassette domain-containing protein [Acetobacteraceae bacterium KSS8]|uniref:ATP-binding cassette domain-containing protein n=1 Tax=Endosaccharibacter trunci TaxID=2812733 RepID=A0ABT1W554_9PROT|nr:ATP-binding cassette domain-containing protein [Acetobacteraceae bacterium KSS8]